MKLTKPFAAAGAFVASLTTVFAQSGSSSSILPPIIQELFDAMGKGGTGIAAFITSRAQFGIYLVLGAIILVAVVYSIMAGIKYIRSEGDPGKIEEAQKSIKAILMGIAAIFVGIIGIILVYVVFGQSIVTPSLPQVCLSAGDSVGCKEYYNNGIDNDIVQWCEGYYKAATALGLPATEKTHEAAITKQATDAGFTIPVSANATLNGADYSGTNPGYLCINPIKGGYLPKV